MTFQKYISTLVRTHKLIDLLASTLCCLHHWSDPVSEWTTAPQAQLSGWYPALDETSWSPWTAPVRQQREKTGEIRWLYTEAAHTFEKPCWYKQGNRQGACDSVPCGHMTCSCAAFNGPQNVGDMSSYLFSHTTASLAGRSHCIKKRTWSIIYISIMYLIEMLEMLLNVCTWHNSVL